MTIEILYSESLLMCFVLIGMMFAANLKNWRSRPVNYVSALYVVFMIEVLLDTVWIHIDGRPELIIWHRLLETVYLTLLPFIAWLWLGHACEQTGSTHMNSGKSKLLFASPFIVLGVLTILSWKYNIVYALDENGTYSRGVGFLVIMVFAHGYMIYASILSWRAAKQAQTRMDKKMFQVQAFFTVPTLLMSIIQSLLLPPGIPCFYYGVIISMFLVFVNSLENQITRDPLTQLANRNTFDRELQERINRQRKGYGGKLWVLMGDMDYLKKVNDTYGHPEGDRALKLVAKVMEKVTEHVDGMACHISGDEFVILVENMEETEVETLIATLTKKLIEESANLPYQLSASWGLARYKPAMSMQELIKLADSKLYRIKKSRC